MYGINFPKEYGHHEHSKKNVQLVTEEEGHVPPITDTGMCDGPQFKRRYSGIQ